jgi:hypothetical protein
VQSLDTTLAAAWHSVVHRREGDFGNARYWVRQANNFSGLTPGIDALALINDAERATGDELRLLAVQRDQWSALFHASLSAANMEER